MKQIECGIISSLFSTVWDSPDVFSVTPSHCASFFCKTLMTSYWKKGAQLFILYAPNSIFHQKKAKEQRRTLVWILIFHFSVFIWMEIWAICLKRKRFLHDMKWTTLTGVFSKTIRASLNLTGFLFHLTPLVCLPVWFCLSFLFPFFLLSALLAGTHTQTHTLLHTHTLADNSEVKT